MQATFTFPLPARAGAAERHRRNGLTILLYSTAVLLSTVLGAQFLAHADSSSEADLTVVALDRAQPAPIDVLLDGGMGTNQPLSLAQNGETLQITPLMYAISAKSCVATVARLVAHGADVNKTSEAQLPLNFALSTRQYDVADFLLDHGAQASRADNLTGMTSLMELALSAQDTDGEMLKKLTKKLLSSGADINARAKRETTALRFAVLNGSTVMTRILLEAGADPNIRNNKGELLLTMAMQRQRPDLAELLKQFGARP